MKIALGADRAKREKAQLQVSRLADKLTGLLGKPKPVEAGRRLVNKIGNDLDRVYENVRASAAIRSERARAEMLDESGRTKAEATAARKDFEGLAFEFEKSEAEIKTAAGEKAEPLPTLDADVKVPKEPEERVATERVKTLLVELQGFKTKERQLFAAARKEIDASFGSKNQAVQQMSELRDLYEFWTTKVLELREAYKTAKVPVGEWRVNADSSDKRRAASTEPDVDGMIDVWKEAGGDAYQVRDWAAIWRARW